MKVAIIGATGFIGHHLCDACIVRGDSITALVRDPAAAEPLARRGVRVVRGDMLDEELLRRTCADADVVFNLAGSLGRWSASLRELEEINGRAPGLLVRCAARAGARKVVHASTAGVSGPVPKGICAAEDYPCSPMTDYQRTKLAGEHSALEAHRDTGLPLVIVRPTFVYGQGDTHKLSLFRAVRKGRMALVNGGVSRLHPVFVDDLVFGILLAAERAPASGEAYILGGESPITTRKLVETVAWALHVPAPMLSLPGGLLLPVASAMEAACRIVGKEPPLTRSRLGLFLDDYAYSIARSKHQLGFKPVVGLPEGMRRTVEWYQDEGLLRQRSRRR